MHQSLQKTAKLKNSICYVMIFGNKNFSIEILTFSLKQEYLYNPVHATRFLLYTVENIIKPIFSGGIERYQWHEIRLMNIHQSVYTSSCKLMVNIRNRIQAQLNVENRSPLSISFRYTM